MLTSARLGEAWPEVSERLGRLLARRGVDPVLAQDIVQDVAVRALDKRVPFTDPDDLYRWAAVAARNIHVDHLRTGGRTTEVDALVGVADDTDVAHAVERRVALTVVWRALAVMRPGEREAILESLDERAAARTAGALVRRHRARATLKKAVGGLIAVTTAVRMRVRAVSPMVRTAGAVALLTPVLVLDLGGGAATGAGGAAGRTAPLRSAPLVSVARVTDSASRAATTPARGSGSGRVVAPAGSGSDASGVSHLPNRNDMNVRAPGGGGVGTNAEPNDPENPIVCVDDLPTQEGREICAGYFPLPHL